VITETAQTMLTEDVASLLKKSVSNGMPPLDAELLLLHVLGCETYGRAWLRANEAKGIPQPLNAAYQQLCARRIANEPLAYITGLREFYGLQLQIDSRVLDPRPDTETLVDWALDVLRDISHPRLVDLGTGSGAVALALQHQRPDAHVLAVDASADALAVAQANAQRLKLPVQYSKGSWLDPLASIKPTVKWHLIASNPPYIAENDQHLAKLHHEPRMALTSGADGLTDIRHIIRDAPFHLCREGWLLLEHGYNQAEAVQTLMRERGFTAVQSRNDLAGVVRCTGGTWIGASDTR